MSLLRKLQSQLTKYVLKHPQLKRAVEQSAQYAARNPTVRRMQSAAQSTYEGAKAKVNANPWGSRFTAFLTANLFGILLFLPMIWGFVKHGYRTLLANPQSDGQASARKSVQEKESRTKDTRPLAVHTDGGEAVSDAMHAPQTPTQRRRKRRDEAAEEAHAQQPEREWATRAASAMFDDTRNSMSPSRGDGTLRANEGQRTPSDSPFAQQTIDFSSSFLVKMGDDAHFKSSLDNEAVTGKVTYNK